ncbi:hypothetical protein [uncultured Aquimarina sp.]|uniref:hypothetical protein n=1 Tax=uncultured Aquimarina sp. TaxID=575652 RepID=UPI002635EA0F|nr:hypothetical protein [uncultured Aquimarina sp.]
MNFKQIVFLVMGLILISCNDKNQPKTEIVTPESKIVKETTPTFQNKGHELIYNFVKKVGDYNTLRNKKDVVYTYTYTTPDGKSDISTEKYIFNNELSYGEYRQHQRTLPDLEGIIEQAYDGNEYWLKNNGKLVKDSLALKRVIFSRPTNFYWFAMFQKLLDPGLKYEYLGKKNLESKNYDVVKISFESQNEKPTDIYQLYINKESGLVDQFLFTVADFGVIETPFLMQMEYEKVDDILIPNKRKYKKSTWDATITESPWIDVTWTNINFNNGLKKEDFTK